MQSVFMLFVKGILIEYYSTSNAQLLTPYTWTLSVSHCGVFLHRAKRGNLSPFMAVFPPSNFLGYMYTIKQPTSMISKVIPQH